MGRLRGCTMVLAVGVVLAACERGRDTRMTSGEAGPDPESAAVGSDTAGMEYDSIVDRWFDTTEAGDRQHMVKGTCPGDGCTVGPMVRIEPVRNAHTKGGEPEIIARIRNEDNIPWVDGTFRLDPQETLYIEVHAPGSTDPQEPGDTTCTARYWKQAYFRGGMVDTTLGLGHRECFVKHVGKNWKRGVARWKVGSIAAWMSCRRGCCQAV